MHFGAGNIGRGLVGSILQEAGYFVVFADINDDLVSALRSRGRYLLTELGDQGRQTVFDNFTALHSTHDRSELISALSSADVITASVGVETLGHIAPIIEAGLLARTSDNKAVVMACENAINASDILFSAIENKEKSVGGQFFVTRLSTELSHSKMSKVLLMFRLRNSANG